MKVIIVSTLLCVGIGFVQCKHFAMTKTDHIPVVNKSENPLNLFINFEYPDTTLIRARGNGGAEPNSTNGNLRLVNKSWDQIFDRYPILTIYFAEEKPIRFYQDGHHGSQKVYGYMYLTKAKLDSLGGMITFPDNVTPTSASVSLVRVIDNEIS